MGSAPRDAFIDWQTRFGVDGAEIVRRLKEAQTDHGTIARSDVRTVAQDLGMPVAAVAGTAAFYADLAVPVRQERHVRMCRGTACFVATGGSADESHLDGDPGGSASVQHVYCLGYCYAAPAAMDGATPVVGRPLIAANAVDRREDVPVIPFRAADSEAVVLAGLTGAARSWQVWPEVVKTTPPEHIRNEVLRAGLRGRGGAGYPIAAKWAAAGAGDPPRYVVANGDEGDPGSYCDRLLMEYDPARVLEGLALAGYAVGAQHAYVLVRSEYPAAVDAMRAAVDEARRAGHLGSGVHGADVDFDVTILVGAGSYVAGEETALLRSVQGLRGGVQARPPYPTARGLAARPTAVNNVETLAAVPWIVQHGGPAYAALGLPEENGTKLVSLNGLFRRPGVYEVEFGTSLRTIVETLGGGMRDGQTLRAVQVGGPLGGFLGSDDLDVPLSAPALAEAGAALGHGGIVAIGDTVRGQELLHHLWTFADAESCGACSPCRVGSRQGLELCSAPDQRLPPERLLQTMERGSLCAFGRGIAGAVRSLLRVYAADFGGTEES